MNKTITISVKDCGYFEEVGEEGYNGNCNHPDGVGECWDLDCGCPIDTEEKQ